MRTLFLALIAFVPSLAFAHPEHSSYSVSSGFMHPIFGVDHLVMLVSFGIFIGKASIFNKAKAIAMACALAAMLFGLMSGKILGYNSIAEGLVIASLIVVAFAIWNVFTASTRATHFFVVICTSLFFAHGYAHGVEAEGNVASFALGMLLACSGLIVLGRIIGHYLFSRWISLITAFTGSALFLAS